MPLHACDRALYRASCGYSLKQRKIVANPELKFAAIP